MLRQSLFTQKKIVDYRKLCTSTQPELKNLRLELENNTATITIDSHEMRQNMINSNILVDLNNSLEIIKQQNKKILILQSGKDGMFVVGADVKEFAYATTKEQVELFSLNAQTLYKKFADNNNIKTISIIKGYALGGGEELALTSDFRIGMPDTKFGQVEVLLGVIPGFDGCQRLTDLLGPVEAARQIVSGEMIDANKALEIGLLDEIIQTKEDIDAFVLKVLKGLTPKKSQTKNILSPNDSAILSNAINDLFDNQTIAIKNLEEFNVITSEQSTNIQNWLLGVKNARVAALNVIIEQLKTDNTNEKSKIEREAFIKLALTPEAKFATRFWLLEKKKYLEEHKIINDLLIKENLFYIPENKEITQDLTENHSGFRMGGNRE